MSISILGIFVADLVFFGEKIPVEGETILGKNFIIGPGGKGSNQAVAISRAGGKVSLIARIGDDHFANIGLNLYQKENINTENKNVVNMDNYNQDNISEIIEKPVSKPKKGYFVQLASFNNETKAKVSVDILNEKLAVSLNGNELQIMRVNLGDGKGIWWRIVTNTMPRGEAETVCARLKSDGNNCIVRSR